MSHETDTTTSPGDPVFEEGGRWYFWNETWTEAFGPYFSEKVARDGLSMYAKSLEGGPSPDSATEPRTAAGRAVATWSESDADLLDKYGFRTLRQAVLAIEAEAQRLTVERLQEAETLLADAQPNGLSMSPVEWQKRRHNLLAALAREETGE